MRPLRSHGGPRTRSTLPSITTISRARSILEAVKLAVTVTHRVTPTPCSMTIRASLSPRSPSAPLKPRTCSITFYAAAESYGYPAKFLSDNAAVFSGAPRRGRVVLESELDRLGIESKHSSPYHPQTCGKVERFHQTLKRYLSRQAPAESLAHLQLQLDTFRTYYNQQRPHRSVDGRTPFQAFQARLKAGPALLTPPVQYRVRRDKLDSGGRVTIRYLGRLRHLHVSYKHRGRAVTLLVAGPHLRVVADDGSILRELILDPTRNYQPVARQEMSTMS